jgi:hypothetical protein
VSAHSSGGAPSAGPGGQVGQGGQLGSDSDTADAVQAALGTEHAAVWSYGLIAAFLDQPLERWTRMDADAHRARRNTIVSLLTDAGRRPVPSEAAYRTPSPVTDQDTAIALAQAAEHDCAAAWHSVLQRCDDPALRRTALDGLTDAATRGARWASRSRTRPLVPALPGES